jgi:hypothetical protein
MYAKCTIHVFKTKTSSFTSILNAFYTGTSPHRQMAVAVLVKEFLIVYEIQWFITLGTRLWHCTVSWASWIHSTPSRCLFEVRFNILFPSVPLSPYMSLYFRIPPKICLLYLQSSFVLHVPPVLYILLTRIIFGDLYTEWSTSLFYFFRYPVIFLSHPDLLLGTLLLNTVNIYFCFRSGLHKSRTARSPGLLNFVQWRLILVGPRHGTCSIWSIRGLEFRVCCHLFKKSGHTCCGGNNITNVCHRLQWCLENVRQDDLEIWDYNFTTSKEALLRWTYNYTWGADCLVVSVA